jgi:DNA-binding PadR family transcriptional regulator
VTVRISKRVSKVQLLVLGELADEPAYGYAILERFRDRSVGFWTEVGRASVYQALRRMESAGLVVGRAQEGADGPDRRVFRITRAGRDRLRAGLDERVSDLSPYETDAGLALGLSHLMSAAEARRALDARDLALRDLLDALRTERARTSADRSPGRAVADAMLDRQEALARAELAWLARFRAGSVRSRR